MSGFADVQRAFAGAVLDTDAAVPAPVSRKAGGVPSRRFGVYRNNVYASLIDVLAGRFPVVARLVDEELFRAMARAYVEDEPPRSAVLLRYGAGVPAFVPCFPPAARSPISPIWRRSNGLGTRPTTPKTPHPRRSPTSRARLSMPSTPF